MWLKSSRVGLLMPQSFSGVPIGLAFSNPGIEWQPKQPSREIVFSPKKQPKAIRVELTRLSGDKLYRLEVDESLEPGEYALSAEGSNQVFCFQVY